MAQQPLNIPQARVFIHADQRNRQSSTARTAGPADAMDIVLRYVRQFVIHYPRQLYDIQTASGDVGGDQHLNPALLEIVQGAGTG